MYSTIDDIMAWIIAKDEALSTNPGKSCMASLPMVFTATRIIPRQFTASAIILPPVGRIRRGARPGASAILMQQPFLGVGHG